MPIDCASRCNSGSSSPESPGPPRRATWLVTVSPAEAPRVGDAPPAGAAATPDWPGDASGTPEEPVKSSVVSLTRGPSQGAGGGRCGGRSTRCHDPANRPGQVLRVLLSPHRHDTRPCASPVPRLGPRLATAGSRRTGRTGKCRNETRRLGRPALVPGHLPAHLALPASYVRGGGSDLRFG